ncbi:MAG: hypothetical protein GX552_03090 [Chloroflexi bacterium]|jgi:trimethylamine--corrinoid protein Co-methyltransferase|nr:hypothetical protein [Chloroflexota bacterium]
MRAAGHGFQVLCPTEEDTLHANVLRIVAEVGLQVEHDLFLERLAAIGGRVDRQKRRVTFAPDVAEAFIASCQRADLPTPPPHIAGVVGLYYGRYLDPETDAFLPMTVERMQRYFQVARALPHVDSLSILGCPLEGVPPALEPLYERYWAWRLGIHPDGSIHRLSLCPFLLEMCEVHAATTGLPIEQVFGGTVYLIPPLKLGYQEAAQVAWFLERGLRVGIGGSMATGGATAPVTLAGMVALTIAEALLLGLLAHALHGERRWTIWMSATALDPRTMMRPYGRPDMVLANMMGAQLARRYGCGFSGHAGLSDAMRPSPQAAAQKLQSALTTLLTCGQAAVEEGLLGIDEVFSPVQMVLDDELVSAMGCFTREYAISDDAIAADLIAAVGPGGNFAAEPHTAEWFRRELWEPTLWERQPFHSWQERDGRTDLERARERVLDILASPAPPCALPDAEETELRKIIQRAATLAK